MGSDGDGELVGAVLGRLRLRRKRHRHVVESADGSDVRPVGDLDQRVLLATTKRTELCGSVGRVEVEAVHSSVLILLGSSAILVESSVVSAPLREMLVAVSQLW